MDNNTGVSEVRPSGSGIQDFSHVTLLDPDKVPGELMNELWEYIKTQAYAFDDFSRNDPTVFAFMLAEPGTLHFILGDKSGYALVHNPLAGRDADIHFILWDRNYKFTDVIKAANEVLGYLFNVKGVERVSGRIPSYNDLAKRIAVLCKFKFEGCVRHGILYKGKYHNVEMYGLLREEFNEVRG